MRTTLVTLLPTEASQKANRPALTPELLAATGARYSRNNEGLFAILEKIDPENLDDSVDRIFRMIDYGHQSIADMAPVAIFIDDISIWLAWYLWSLSPTGAGQESSTRYLKIGPNSIPDPSTLGLPEALHAEWHKAIAQAFSAYETSLAYWQNLGERLPHLTGIPPTLLEDPNPQSQRKVQRLRRNYAFDRARVFLPAAARTNVMLLMSARAWVGLIQMLLSHPLPEPQRLGQLLHGELGMAAPRLLRHARALESSRNGLAAEFANTQSLLSQPHALASEPYDMDPAARLEVSLPKDVDASDLAAALAFHDNRYAVIGSPLARTAVRFAWEAVAFAEVRDLNRHRTGSKYCPMAVRGFYSAQDVLPEMTNGDRAPLHTLTRTGVDMCLRANAQLAAGDWSHVYWLPLGAQLFFEHTTTADKFIYEAELRTGTGAHYRYAKHLRDQLTLLYAKFPDLRGRVLEGSAEPE